MLRLWLCFVCLALACDWTLVAQPDPLNVWLFLAMLDTQASPLIICLTGSDDAHIFTLDDAPEGCRMPSVDLIIQ